MKQTIDFSFKEVSDNGDGKNLFGFSAQTVNKCINKIEQNYFQGRKIYHGLSDSKNNAVVFRYEIKELLLLLLKIELEDVFRGGNSKNSGVSESSVDKIIELYAYALNNLPFYQYRVLIQFSDMEDGLTFFEAIQEFRNELSRLLIITATKYHDHTASYYKMFIKRIRDISVSMIYGSNDLRFLNSTLFLQPLDLRKALIKAINQMCDDFYFFKDDNICKRKKYINEHNDDYEDLFDEYYNYIRKSHLCYKDLDLNNQREYNSDELIEKGTSVAEIRNDLSSFLQRYYEKKYPFTPKEYASLTTEEKINDVLGKVENALYEYIEIFCKMQKLCYGKLSDSESKGIFQNESFLREFYNRRFYLLHMELCDWSFAKCLLRIEDYLSRLILNDDIPTDEEIKEVVATTITDYGDKIKRNAKLVSDEFAKYDNKEIMKQEYGRIIDNIEDIEAHCEALAKNLIAMILKRESDRDKDYIPF